MFSVFGIKVSPEWLKEFLAFIIRTHIICTKWLIPIGLCIFQSVNILMMKVKYGTVIPKLPKVCIGVGFIVTASPSTHTVNLSLLDKYSVMG